MGGGRDDRNSTSDDREPQLWDFVDAAATGTTIASNQGGGGGGGGASDQSLTGYLGVDADNE